MQRGSGCAFLCWASWHGSFQLPLELRGLHVRHSDCLFICLPMFYLVCALYMFCRQAGRSGRNSMGICMSRDTSLSRGTSTSQ